MKSRYGLSVVAAIFAVAFTLRADVTVDLGQSAQNFVETGIGQTASGFNQWFIQQGSCAFNGTDTTCVLSGDYTGSAPGYTGGTYSLVTTYAGDGPSPLQGISTTAGGNAFEFSVIPPGTTITLDLDESGGPDYTIPLWNGSSFVNDYDVEYTGTATCTGLPPSEACSTANVGATAGATISGPVTGAAEFSTAVPAPEPTSLSLLCIGILGTMLIARRKFVPSL
jgi:hypothetical protein